MKPSIYFITLVAENLERAIEFYCDGVGLPLSGKGPPQGELCYGKFQVQPGLSLVLVSEKQFEEFTGIDTRGKRSSQVALSIPKKTRDEVKNLYEKAIRAGGTSIAAPQEMEWGYSASVKDLDGNIIEIIEDTELPEISETELR